MCSGRRRTATIITANFAYYGGACTHTVEYGKKKIAVVLSEFPGIVLHNADTPLQRHIIRDICAL